MSIHECDQEKHIRRERERRGTVRRHIPKFCLVAAVLLAALCLAGPVAFARDGLLTRKKVEDYRTQYDLGMTRRHDCEVSTIYLFCPRLEEPVVEYESYGRGYAVEAEQILPFLYRWERKSDWAYRVTVGEDKYYFTIVST